MGHNNEMVMKSLTPGSPVGFLRGAHYICYCKVALVKASQLQKFFVETLDRWHFGAYYFKYVAG
ncbi:hypothetical protein ES703_81032 [subsurface metagenome]